MTREDVLHLVRMSCRPPLEKGRVLVTIKPLCFRVDGAEVPQPVGMQGNRLELDAEITTAAGW